MFAIRVFYIYAHFLYRTLLLPTSIDVTLVVLIACTTASETHYEMVQLRTQSPPYSLLEHDTAFRILCLLKRLELSP